MSNKKITGTFADNGSSAAIEVDKHAIAFIGSAGGTTFGSGTVAVQFMAPDGQWCSSQETASSSNVLSILVQIPTSIRLTLSGATSPDLDYSVQSDQTNLVD